MQRALTTIRITPSCNLIDTIQKPSKYDVNIEIATSIAHFSPRMAAVARQHDPLPTLDSHGTGEVATHVPWRLNNPHALVAKEIHSLLKRPKLHPWPLKRFPVLGSVSRMEKVAVPLKLGQRLSLIVKMSVSTKLLGTRTKISLGIRKDVFDGTAMIPMRMAFGFIFSNDSQTTKAGCLPENDCVYPVRRNSLPFIDCLFDRLKGVDRLHWEHVFTDPWGVVVWILA
jgi:hypothetical protein